MKTAKGKETAAQSRGKGSATFGVSREGDTSPMAFSPSITVPGHGVETSRPFVRLSARPNARRLERLAYRGHIWPDLSDKKVKKLPPIKVLLGQDDTSVNALEDLIDAVTEMALEKGIEVAKSKLDAMIEIYSTNIQVPRYSMREAKMIAKAQDMIIGDSQWVTGKDIAELAQFKSTNKSAGVAKWKSANKIFSVFYSGEEFYPIYALDKSNGFRPLEGLKPILELFSDKKDGWGTAYWFGSVNGYLGGRIPKDVIHSDPELVLKAAAVEVAGVIHA